MPKQTAYVNDATVQFGAAKTTGKFLGVKRTDLIPKFVYCTPDGKPVHQVYRDDEGTEYSVPELHRGVMEGKELKYVGKEVIEEAKKSELPYNKFPLMPHPAQTVERYLFPSNNQAYVFVPGFKKGNDWVGRDGHPKVDPEEVKAIMGAHDFIVAMVEKSGAVFLTLANLRGNEGLFRVGMYQGYLTFQKQMFPEELHQFEELMTQIPPAALKKGLQMVVQKLTDFDPNAYKSTIAEKLAAVAEGDYDPVAGVTKTPDQEFDLMAMLNDEEAWA